MKKNRILPYVILVTFLVSIIAVSPVNAATVGMVAEWNLDEGMGCIAYDSTTNANDGMLSGGKFGNALYFDGDNDYVAVDFSDTLDFTDPGQDFSAEAWINVEALKDYNLIFQQEDSVSPGRSWLYIRYNGALRSFIGGTATETAGGLITPGYWHHVALSFDKNDGSQTGTLTLYVDGSPIISAVRTFEPSLGDYRIGIHKADTHDAIGLIDEVRISNFARTSFDLTQAPKDDAGTVALWHFDESVGTDAFDETINENDGIIIDATWAGPTWVSTPTGSGLNFDGVDDYVSAPIFPLTDEVTIDAWVYFIDGSPEGNYGGIICNLNGRHNRNRLLLMGATLVLWQVYINGETHNHFFTLPSDQRNAWHHYVLVYDGANVRLFWDEEQVGEDQPQTGSLDSGTTPLTIGLGSTIEGYYYLKGMIDEVRIWNVAVPLDTEIDVNPDTLNLKSNGQWITCYIELPDGFDVNDIDVSSIKLTADGKEILVDPAASTEIGDYDSDGVPDLMVKFVRSELIDNVNTIDFENADGKFYDLPTTINGTADGIPFEGTDTIRVRK